MQIIKFGLEQKQNTIILEGTQESLTELRNIIDEVINREDEKTTINAAIVLNIEEDAKNYLPLTIRYTNTPLL